MASACEVSFSETGQVAIGDQDTCDLYRVKSAVKPLQPWPSSGYADNIDNGRIGPLSAVACHNTPVVDFVEDFIVEFVNALDRQLCGQLKPRVGSSRSARDL